MTITRGNVTLGVYWLIVLHMALMAAAGSSVRQFGWDSDHEGRVEMFYNGTWGIVCGGSWDHTSARVACRELGLPGGIGYKLSSDLFVDTNDTVWQVDFSCNGNESSLQECVRYVWEVSDCIGYYAWVNCVPDDCGLRLVNGSYPYEGLMQISFNGTWVYLEQDYSGLYDTEVPCSTLGLTGGMFIPITHYDEAVRTIFQLSACYYAQKSLFDCGYIKVYPGYLRIQDGIQCNPADPCSSSMCHNGGVCNNITVAGAQCDMDPCADVTDMTCVSTTHHDYQCKCDTGWSDAECDMAECALRLVNGSTPYEGRVELLLNGTWSIICAESWNSSFSRIACRTLGLTGGVSYNSTYQGVGPVIVDLCLSSESSLYECGYGNSSPCDNETIIGLQCDLGPCSSSPCHNGGVCNNLMVPGVQCGTAPCAYVTDQTCVDATHSYTGFRCACAHAWGGTNCDIALTHDPAVRSITPSFGPLSGGTQLTIMGEYFQADVTHVYIGNHVRCIVTSSDAQSASATCPMGNALSSEVARYITVEFAGGRNITTEFTFTYKGDPVIESIHPLATLGVGGTTLTVTGNSMDSVAKPVLIMIIDLSIKPGHVTSGTTQETIIKDEITLEKICQLHSSIEIHCITPTVPEHYLPATDSQEADKQTRNVYIGFLFDGIQNYTDLRTNDDLKQYSQIQVTITPSLESEELKIMFKEDTTIDLKGNDIDKVPESFYAVSIGQGQCAIHELTDSSIICLPPQTAPGRPDDGLRYPIVVSIGTNLNHNMGTIEYKMPLNLYVIVGCGVGGGIILIVMLIIVPVVVNKRRHKSLERRQGQQTSVSDDIHLPPIPPGGYDELFDPIVNKAGPVKPGQATPNNSSTSDYARQHGRRDFSQTNISNGDTTDGMMNEDDVADWLTRAYADAFRPDHAGDLDLSNYNDNVNDQGRMNHDNNLQQGAGYQSHQVVAINQVSSHPRLVEPPGGLSNGNGESRPAVHEYVNVFRPPSSVSAGPPPEPDY